MTNAFALFRSLIIYGVCLPLAIFIGYLLATPTDFGSMVPLGLLLLVMMLPLFLKWHYAWLVLTWNCAAGLFFLPGRFTICWWMICISFTISVLGYIMNRKLKFIYVPSVVKPLLFLLAVVLVTAKFTGGLGLGNLLGGGGSDMVGGKRYFYLIAAIVGYFALTAQRIPEEKAGTYTNMFLLSGAVTALGNLAAIIAPSLYIIFLVIPADPAGLVTAGPGGGTILRLGGLASASLAVINWLLARYGIEGILDSRKYWRFVAFVLFVVLTMLGGFRSMVIGLGLFCVMMFYMEGLFRSRLLPASILIGVLAIALTIPFANKLPLSMQRSLTFLPLNLDMEAVLSSRESTDWRLEMWKAVLPTVPQYLILGKGYGIDAAELDMLSHGMNRGDEGQAGAIMAGDYHNGPLSVIIPFGLFGVVGFIWFLVAGFRVLQKNYRFGDPTLQRINRFLLAWFSIKIMTFFIIFGSLHGDLLSFVGIVGFSIALNGGVREPVAEPMARPTLNRFKLAQAATR